MLDFTNKNRFISWEKWIMRRPKLTWAEMQTFFLLHLFFRSLFKKVFPQFFLIFTSVLFSLNFYILIRNFILFAFKLLNLREERERESLKNNTGERKWSVGKPLKTKGQILCQYVLNKRSASKVFLHFYIVIKK
jgi:hypothetical protein